MANDETSTNAEQATPAAAVSKWWFVGGLLFAILILCILPCGLPWPLEILFTVILGWIPFLYRNVESMRPSGEQFAIWLGTILLVVGLCQGLGAGFLKQDPANSTGDNPSKPPAWRLRWTLIALLAVHAMFVGGLAVVGAVQQTTWLATSPGPWLDPTIMPIGRILSGGNLKRLSHASAIHHDAFDRFPQSKFDAAGQPLHSWMTTLLPFIEEHRLYDKIDRARPWDDVAQQGAFSQRVEMFENPGVFQSWEEEAGLAPAHFAANIHVIGPQRQTKYADVTDGSAHTILYGEINTEIRAWGDPINWRDPADGVNRSSSGFGSPYRGGAQFVFLDGSVQFLSDDIDPAVLKALSTPNGGEANHGE